MFKLMKTPIYAIALTAATLTSSPLISSESIIGSNIYANYIIGIESTTSNQIADNGRYLNSIMIRESFRERLIEKHLYGKLPHFVENIFNNLCDKCSYFNIREVYADYSTNSNAIRLDMVIDNGFLLIVRKKIEEEQTNNNVAVSLSKGNENYLVDYLDLNNLTTEVHYCIQG